MPYQFCNNCLRLSPILGETCLECGMNLDMSTAGRRIIFTQKEAELRGLLWRTHDN